MLIDLAETGNLLHANERKVVVLCRTNKGMVLELLKFRNENVKESERARVGESKKILLAEGFQSFSPHWQTLFSTHDIMAEVLRKWHSRN